MSDLDITAPPSHLRDADGEPVPLDVHLADVANRVRATSSDTPTTPNGSSIADLTTRLAWIHDIGKLTSWFQKHLHRPDDAPPVEGPSHHAPLGALVAYYVLDSAGFGGDDPLIGFIAVAKHHGRLPNTTEYIKKITADPDTGTLHQLFRKDTLRQAEDISENEPGVANALIEEATDGVGSWEGFCEWIEDIRRTGRIDDLASHALNKMTLLPEPDRLDTGFYSGCLQVWSNLVLADKTSARHLTQETDLPTSVYESLTPRRTAIDAAVRSLQHDAEHSDIGERTQTLNQKREQARQEARTQAEALDTAEQSLVTLTLPTGLGKTLTGLDAGLTILKQKPGNGRIVYALPFTSIIDQVAAETESIFDTDRLNGGLLTVDHHLSETSVPLHRKTEATEETPTDTHSGAESALGESWRSGIITTTFVQLFESLTGPGNTQSMKLPSLSNSVVILDEPQTLPHRWWALIKQIAQLLMDDYNVTVIAMTATQPKLFDDLETTPPVELISEPDRYYEGLDRVRFALHPSAEAALNGTPDPVGYEAAGSQITESASKGASVLAICNTIDSARELSESIEEQSGPLAINSLYDELLPKDAKSVSADISVDTTVARAVDQRTADQPLLVHLTTRHRPVDRQHLIETTIELTKRGLPVIFVSTQLIEAGVDVSFDRVYRDFAPLDSIVQAAGRCNRSFERDTGLVTTWVLKPPSGRNRSPSTAVYDYDGESLTKITADALASVYEGDPLEEHAVTRTAVKSYFRLLDKRNIGKREYVEHLEKANADALGRLSLIDDRPTVEVIVTRTEAEKEHVQDLQNAYNDHDWETFRDTLSVVKPLQVSVPLPGDNEDSREDPRLGDKRDQPLHIDTQPDPYVSYFNEIDGVVLPTGTSRAQLL